MSDFRPINQSISAAPQINFASIKEAARKGYTMIINNRPDHEEAGQPTNADLAAEAEAIGIRWAHIPVIPGELTVEAIEQMAYALRDSDTDKNAKVLAFCRSGTRSCTLWGLAQAYTASQPVEDIISEAAGAGYDIANFAPTLAHLHQNANS